MVTGSLVSLVDIAPTVLGLAGVAVPPSMQGVDIAPLFDDPTATVREYIHAERNWHNFDDHQRAVRDRRFKYIRHAFPREPVPLASDLYASAAYKDLLRLRDADELTAEQLRLFMIPRPGEELYDTVNDHWEFENLVRDPAYADTLERLRAECDRWVAATGDVPPGKRFINNVDIFTGEKYGKTSGPPERRPDK